METLVTGTFHDEHAANHAIDKLMEVGYASDDISVIMSKETRSHFDKNAAPGETQGAHVAKGAAGGAAIGGTLGAIVAGALATTGAIGAILGAATPHDQVQKVQKDVDAGMIVVAVQADTADTEEAAAILHGH